VSIFALTDAGKDVLYEYDAPQIGGGFFAYFDARYGELDFGMNFPDEDSGSTTNLEQIQSYKGTRQTTRTGQAK
jgi:hypothetical protein